MRPLEFRVESDGRLHGLERFPPPCERGSMYLGSAPVVGVQSVTDALGEFNLRTAIAPGEWEEQTLQQTAAILAAIRVD